MSEDAKTIRDVVENWALWRDAGDWERFATCWHPDGVMMATWFQGPFREFIRVSNDSGRVGRLPIIERFGTTVVGHLANAPGVLQEEVGGLQEVLSRNILSQIDRFLGRRKVDRG